MSIDDRDYMLDRNGASDMEARRFRTSEQQKARQAEELKNRFARYSGSSRGLAAPKARRSRFFLIVLVLVIGAMFWMRWPDIPARFLTWHANSLFPATGAVRWFIPVAVDGVGDVTPLTITGLAEAGQHVVVKLDTWEAHAPIAMIPIRGGETATLQVPLGRYRISYAPNASWGIVSTWAVASTATSKFGGPVFSRTEQMLAGASMARPAMVHRLGISVQS